MLGKFKFVDKILEGMSQSVNIKAQRCTRMKHKRSTCNLCESNCALGAITVGSVGTKIEIDWDKCNGCEICVNICPTGVYSTREGAYKINLNKDIKYLNPDTHKLMVTCKRLSVDRRKEYTPDEGKIRVCECMGSYNMPDLIYLYTHGVKRFEFIFPDCGSCPNKYGLEILEEELFELSALAEYLEYLEGVEIKKEDEVLSVEFVHTFEVQFAKEPKLSEEIVTRRGIFDLVKSTTIDSALQSAAVLTPQELPDRTSFSDEKYLPAKRSVFLDSLIQCGKLLKNKIDTGAYFFLIEVTDDCNFCNVCARFCPTGALFDGEVNQLYLNPSQCVSCGMCLKACYHKYIRRVKSLNLTEFFNDILIIDKSLPAEASPEETSLDEASIDEASPEETSLDTVSIDETSLNEASPEETSLDEVSLDETSLDEASLNEVSFDEGILDNDNDNDNVDKGS